MKQLIVIFITLQFAIISASGQNTSAQDSLMQTRIDALFLIEDRAYEIYDAKHVQKEDWTKLRPTPDHPGLDSVMNSDIEKQLLSEINRRRRELKSDTLLVADYFYVWKPYFDWARNEDPHYRIATFITAPDPKKSDEIFKHLTKKQKKIPVITCDINDTIVVYKSFDPLFKSGDMILSINDVPMSEYLKYNYNDRFSEPYVYMCNYYFSMAVDSFDVRFLRAGKELTVQTEGKSASEIYKVSRKTDQYNIKVYENAGCGYIQIKQFFFRNDHLIKTLHSAIADFKSKGIANVIVDVRRNPGGGGHKFDEVISIFTDKPVIDYMKGQKLRVSKKVLQSYEFATEDMMGKNINFPDDEIFKEVKLDAEMYVDGMKYYILVSENTASMAATFVNILQYNNLATIVGEPLLRNALKYGEVASGYGLLYTTLLYETGVSTVEFDEYTKAVDGVIMPDIHIPYVAREYMTGEDAVLNKLLDIIKNQ